MLTGLLLSFLADLASMLQHRSAAAAGLLSSDLQTEIHADFELR
jgi:hypothetical protein